MKEQLPQITFDKNKPIREPLLNSYGFDLTDENAILYTTAKFIFTVLGFRTSTQFDRLTATVKVTLNPHIQPDFSHVDKLDLYIPDRVTSFARTAAFQLKANEPDIKKAVCDLRDKLEKFRLDELKDSAEVFKKVPVADSDRKEATNILKADNILECIETLLKRAGVVTENENGLRLFFILLSRHFDKPLHVLFQGSPQLSTMLMDAVISTVPAEQLHEQTSISPSSMYYTRNKNYWKNKVLYMKSMDKHFKAASTIKEFIDNSVLKRHTTENDFNTQQLYASNKIVPGPICLMGYSDDDNLNNRFFQECFFIRLEENDKNRLEMFDHYRKENAGLLDAQEQDKAKHLLMTIQRLIKPVNVVIPFAMQLQPMGTEAQPIQSFCQLMTFIKAVALLHQHQLKIKKDANGTEYIEASPDHLETAIELFKNISISRSDILSSKQRSLLERLKTLFKDKKEGFRISEALAMLKVKNVSSFYRDFAELRTREYVKKISGNKKSGEVYSITTLDGFEELNSNVTPFETQLKKIREQVSQKILTKIPKTKTTANIAA